MLAAQPARRTAFCLVYTLLLLGMFVLPPLASTSSTWRRTMMHTQSTVIRGSSGSHTFTVRLSKGPFHRNRHWIWRDRQGCLWMDGKAEEGPPNTRGWWGTDGDMPVEEFTAFRVEVDGRPWRVLRRLYRDCYEPNINIGVGHMRLSEDGQLLTIEASGSDAAGHYYVTWYLQRDGKHHRDVRDSGC